MCVRTGNAVALGQWGWMRFIRGRGNGSCELVNEYIRPRGEGLCNHENMRQANCLRWLEKTRQLEMIDEVGNREGLDRHRGN